MKRHKIFKAIMDCDYKAAQKILEDEPDCINAQTKDKEKPIHYASSVGDIKIAELLIENGADVNESSSTLIVPIVLAIWNRNTELLKLLIENGADVTIEKGQLVRYFARRTRDKKIAKILVDAGAIDQLIDDDIPNSTDAFRACSSFRSGTLKRLIANNPDLLNAIDIYGRSLLHEASANGDVDSAKVLIDAGIDINIKDRRGETPIQSATKFDKYDAVELLEELGADSTMPISSIVHNEYSVEHDDGNSPINGAVLDKLIARHVPNPSNIHWSVIYPKNPFPYMWYYKSEVINTTDKPLQIIWFDHFYFYQNKWYPDNIKQRPLTGYDFSGWYGVETIIDGLIPAGKTATCDLNWHGFGRPHTTPRKWAYRAADPDGSEYYAEAVIEAAPIEE